MTTALDLSALRPEPFQPAGWARGPHRQTLLARYLRREGGIPFRRDRVDTPDGDFVDLDFPFAGDTSLRSDVLVIVLHGLEGSARSRYALEVYRQLAARGMPAVGFNFRSCSGELNRTTRLYHSGETGDLGLVLAHLRRAYPERRMAAVGFSLGGNVLLKHLAESAEREVGGDHLEAAVSVSVPFDLGVGARHLERMSGRLYMGFLLRKLRRKTAAKRAMLAPLIDVDRAVRARTFYEFDDAATAPLHGFADADEYYRRSSSGPRIGAIATPTLMIQSEDDPFLPVHAIPRDAADENPSIVTAFSACGGHVGFLGGSARHPVFWAEREAAAFISRVMR